MTREEEWLITGALAQVALPLLLLIYGHWREAAGVFVCLAVVNVTTFLRLGERDA